MTLLAALRMGMHPATHPSTHIGRAISSTSLRISPHLILAAPSKALVQGALAPQRQWRSFSSQSDRENVGPESRLKQTLPVYSKFGLLALFGLCSVALGYKLSENQDEQLAVIKSINLLRRDIRQIERGPLSESAKIIVKWGDEDDIRELVQLIKSSRWDDVEFEVFDGLIARRNLPLIRGISPIFQDQTVYRLEPYLKPLAEGDYDFFHNLYRITERRGALNKKNEQLSTLLLFVCLLERKVSFAADFMIISRRNYRCTIQEVNSIRRHMSREPLHVDWALYEGISLTALHLAVAQRDSALLKWMIRNDFDCDVPALNKAGSPYQTPLITSIRNLDRVCFNYLVNTGKVDVNYTTPGVHCPLIEAIRQGDLYMVKTLIDCGADVNNSKEATLPLDAAREMGYSYLIPVLLDAGAKTRAERSIPSSH